MISTMKTWRDMAAPETVASFHLPTPNLDLEL